MSSHNISTNELDHKNNNDRPDLNEIKLTVKDDTVKDDTFYSNDNQNLNLNENNSTIQRTITNSAENPLFNTIDNSSINLDNVNLSNNNDLPQNSPPAYSDVPGIVPISAGTNNGPPPSYDEVINPNVPPPTYQSLFGQVQQARKNAKTLPDLIRKLIIILLGTIGLAILISFTILIPFTMIIVGGSNLDNCKAEKIPLFLLIGGITWLTKNLSNFFSQCSRRNRSRTTTTTTNTNTSSTNNDSCTNNNSSNPCASRYSSNTCQAESNTTSSCTNNNSTNGSSSRCVINLENDQTIPDSQHNKTKRRDFLINCFITAWFLTGCIMVYRIYPPNYTDPTSPNYCNKTVYVYAFWLLTSTFIIFSLFICCICTISLSAIFSSSNTDRANF